MQQPPHTRRLMRWLRLQFDRATTKFDDFLYARRQCAALTICAACSVAATICPRRLQVVTWTATYDFQLGIVTALVGDAGRGLKFLGSSRSKDLAHFRLGINRPGDLDLSISKWNHGSPVPRPSLVPIFSLLRPSVLDLWSGTGQTDRRTEDGHQCLMPSPHPVRQGHKQNWSVLDSRPWLLQVVQWQIPVLSGRGIINK